MKLFTILLTLFLMPLTALAGSWVSQSEIVAKEIKNIHSKKRMCMAMSLEDCFNADKKDMRYHVLGMVDDLDSPKYIKQDTQSCSDKDNCEILFAGLDCSPYAVGSFPVMVADYSEVYCAEPNGYDQKEDLVIDQALKDIVDAQDAQDILDNASKKTKRGARRAALKACAKTKIADYTASIQKNCIRSIAREMMRLELSESEL